MMMTKKIGLVASLVLASSFAVAGTHPGGGHGSPGDPNKTFDLDPFANHLSSGSIEYVSSFVPGVAGYFTNTFNFTVPDTVALWDFSATFEDPTMTFGFSDISLNNGSVGVVNSQSGTATYSEMTASNYVQLAPGGYELYISGMSASVDAEYGFNAVLSPIPEPSSIALMLGGLGLVGFMAARRCKNT